MSKKKDNFWIYIIGIILIILFLAFYFNDFRFGTLATVPDIETQLKQDYVTFWADETDGAIHPVCKPVSSSEEWSRIISEKAFPFCISYSQQYYYEDEKFISQGYSYATTDSNNIIVGAGSGSSSISFRIKQKFKGQEVALLLDSGQTGYGVCNIAPAGRFKCTTVGGQITCSETIIKFVPHTFDTSIYDVYQDEIKTQEINVGDGFNIGVNCRMYGGSGDVEGLIKFLGYKAEYACDLSSDEVWIQEQFAQPFNISDLEFMPTKFCHETRPFVLRVLNVGEKPISREEGIQSLNTGKILPASSTDLITVNYATYYVTGVNNKCEPNQANVKIGGKWVCQDVIKPLTVVVQCEDNSQCPQPLKNQCPNYFTGCVNNLCTYDETILNSEVCKNEVVTIVKQIEIMKEQVLIDVQAENFFTFSQNKDRNSFNFGNAKFTAIIPSFICPNTGSDAISPPNPNSQCWTTTMDWDRQLIPISNGITKSITPFVDVTYFASGSYIQSLELLNHNKEQGFSTNFRRDEWGNSFLFNVKDNAIIINLISDNQYTLKDEVKNIKIFIQNNLPPNSNVFAKVRQTRKLTNEILAEQRIPIVLNNGVNQVEVPIDTKGLGINQIEIQLFYVINADREVLIRTDKIITNYNVVTKLPTFNPEIIIIKEIADCRDYGCSKGYTCKSVTDFDYVCTKESLWDKFIKLINNIINKMFFS